MRPVAVTSHRNPTPPQGAQTRRQQIIRSLVSALRSTRTDRNRVSTSSSAGRASRCQREGRQFESGLVLHTKEPVPRSGAGFFVPGALRSVLVWSLGLKSMPTEGGAASDEPAASMSPTKSGEGNASSNLVSCSIKTQALPSIRGGVVRGRARSQDMGVGRGAHRTADRGPGARAELVRGALAHGLPLACHRPEWLEPSEALKPKKPPQSGDSLTHPSGCAYFISTKAEFPFPGIPGTPAWCSGFIRFGARVSALEPPNGEVASAGLRGGAAEAVGAGGPRLRSLRRSRPVLCIALDSASRCYRRFR